MRRCQAKIFDSNKKEKVIEGWFHGWGQCFEEFETGPGNYTIAIIEAESGDIVTAMPEKVKFDKPEFVPEIGLKNQEPLKISHPQVTSINYTRVCPLLFKGQDCGYKGNESWCDKTFTCCWAIGNSHNWRWPWPNQPSTNQAISAFLGYLNQKFITIPTLANDTVNEILETAKILLLPLAEKQAEQGKEDTPAL